MLNGAECHIFTPRTLLRDPGGLWSYFSEHRGTLMTGPDFSYDHLIGGVSAAQLATLDFSSWRLAYNGAEPVNAQTLHRFTETLAPHGLDPSVMFPVYGMAEATLAVSYPEPGAGPAVLHVDRSQLGPGDTVITVAADAAGSRALVSVGRPVHGIDLRIIDEHGSPTETGCVGEIEIRGEAVTDGYYNDPDATAAAFRNGWLRTGDLGFTHDDHLYVMGRSKEMIIVHGENYFPSDVEEIVRTVPGVFRNRGIAFPGRRDGYEYMGVIVETKAHPEQQEDIRTEVRRRIAEDLGLNTVEVHLVEPHWLPRTTSGKWQRLAAAKALGALD
jgi:acyl-CoA synthetase (AMP-forming)/AMP-acid ligase II